MKRLSRAHREDDDGDADADDDAFFSRATFDGGVSALFYYTRLWEGKCFFVRSKQAKRRKIVTQISSLNDKILSEESAFSTFREQRRSRATRRY